MPALASVFASPVAGALTAENMSDLLGEISRKSRPAFAHFYDLVSTTLYSVAHGILHNAADAADVLQETFVHIWTRAATFDATRGSARNWAIAICRHKAIDRWRSRGRHTRLLDDHAFYFECTTPDAPRPRGSDGAEIVLVRTAVAALPPRDRRVLELAFFGGFTHQEISAQLQEPVGTVKARVRRAMFKLRGALRVLHREIC